MKAAIFLGSPRPEGNTARLTEPFISEMRASGAEVRTMPLHDKDIRPCIGCFACQDVQGEYGCAISDDMGDAVDLIRWADLIVLATPIYTWFCPGIMKNLLDRHFGLNKYYGRATGSLWEGKSVAILATHGYGRDYACAPFETGILRLCEHSKLNYLGLFSAEDDEKTGFVLTGKIEEDTRNFARKLVGLLESQSASGNGKGAL